MNQLIQQYLNELSDLRRASGTGREGVVSEAFKDLLKGCAKSHDLIFIPQYELPRQDGNRRIVDGALVYDLRIPFGYWEAKDEEDDLDKEIAAKFRRGYPRDNIIFEDSQTAVLMQYGNEVMRCPVDDTEKLNHLLDLFFKYERPEVADFRKAVVQFQADLPHVLEDLRAMIEKAQKENVAFRKGSGKFLKHAQETINPALNADDVREMLIQHILTEEIFSKVFDEDDFHRNNNVAKELYALEGLFFTGALKKTTLKGLESYYNAIRTTAHQIATHTEKQTFLKVIYEGFYKVYNKKAADRLGVVYTPNEIVRFMVESADWLCQKHFSKSLIEKGVEILDPATGTGTFVCELMEHFRGQKQKLAWKYKEELHANEVAILPYYVANLNIEATYAAITGQYAEFPNLCFVDTLDNVEGLGKFSGYQEDMFGSVSEENVARIKRQNKRKISVVIGNPPYNANQQNENDNNKNRTYPRIDERIKGSYIKESTAQKTKAYDMYTRFFRWASDRLKDEGIVAFITNISDWGLAQFRAHYDAGKKPKRAITKDAIFHYIYGALHDPIYRNKYVQNLKREFPRIPFYADFWKWAEWGEKLMALHIGYEAIKPWKLKRVDVPDDKSNNAKLPPKPSLKADRENGVIVLDSETQLTGIPSEVWSYQLANRPALEWILDQYKEWTPKDPTIRERFNTYRFADHKETVIDLLMRVTRVSVETMEIVEAMRSEKRA